LIFEIDDIASAGSVRDVPGYQLPPEVWTLALNLRYQDNSLATVKGWTQVFGTPLFAPHFALPVATVAQMFWLYTSLAKAVVFDGVTHTDVTRVVGGDYTANDTYFWNGTVFGGIAILNNGSDIPQAWLTPSVGTKLVNLPNWPTTLRARVIRSFGPFLVAASITDSGVVLPHQVRWSHEADPGTVPTSWDITDPTVDAGEVEFPDVQSGVIFDALPLASNMYIYKEASVWKMRYVGGQSIFDFGQSSWLTTAGLLGPRCVCITGDGTKHVLATQDDIIWHNGSNVQSILSLAQRKRLQDDMDPDNAFQSFIFPNPFNSEVWFCYPSSGNVYPNRALILNYKRAGGTDWVVTEADGITFRNTAVGTIESFNPEAWNTGTDLWIDDTGPWSELQRRRVVLLSPTASKFYLMDSGTTRDGVVFDRILQREGLALIGKSQNGKPVVDFQKMKMFKRLWPKLTGGPVNVRFGAQQFVNQATAWSGAQPFNPISQMYVDPFPTTGRAVGFEISSQNEWKLDGYKLDMEPLGEF